MEATAAATRPYRMGARAEATAATRRAIADAFLELFTELHYDELTLDLVAQRAGVSVQTVIRRFGSKADLFAAVTTEVADGEAARRAETPVGDPVQAVIAVIDHYERIGDTVLHVLAQEDRLPELRALADKGRRIHRAWVDRAFGPALDAAPSSERRRRRAQLAALTDIYVWKVLRRDQGLGRRQTEIAMTEMVCALLQGGK